MRLSTTKKNLYNNYTNITWKDEINVLYKNKETKKASKSDPKREVNKVRHSMS